MELNKKTILIIEDNLEIREGTSEILELSGYRVLMAPEGKTGVEMALQHLPDLILCDIMMPELDGFGVLFMLNKHPQTLHIPFVFMTAKSERADMRKAMEMGADDYLTKPFDDVELLNAIETRFKKQEQLALQTHSVAGETIQDPKSQEQLLVSLIDRSRAKQFRKKQRIFEEQDQPIFVYFIKKGKVRSFLYYMDGRELSTGIYIENQFFGYEALMLQAAYTDNVETLEDSEIVQIPKEEFFELLYRKPAIANRFIKMLSGNVKEKEEKLLGFAYDSVRKRVAQALIQVAEKTYPNEHSEACAIRISREDLASLAGTANETISRMLTDFKDEKLIIKEGNAIRILSMHKLKNIKQ